MIHMIYYGIRRNETFTTVSIFYIFNVNSSLISISYNFSQIAELKKKKKKIT